MSRCIVYLVPGFFGFTSLGVLSYFHRVTEMLTGFLEDRGYTARVEACPTLPTGSIPRRAEALGQHVASTGGLDADEIHFIGHSTGGLDARVLLSHKIHGSALDVENRIGERTLSLTTISTPHHGTPLASFFTTLQGRHILGVLARMATTMGGRLSLVTFARFLATIAKTDDFFGRRNTMLDKLADSLFRNMKLCKNDDLWKFLDKISKDQGVILQLTPESMNLFNALANNRPGVFYSSIATAAPPPPFSYHIKDVASPERAILASLFVIFHSINRWNHRQYPFPQPDEETKQIFKKELDFNINSQTNDGVVPTFSQVHGRLLHAIAADHLDVVGQFYRKNEPLSDWLPSGATFGLEQFEWLWARIADEIIRSRNETNFQA